MTLETILNDLSMGETVEGVQHFNTVREHLLSSDPQHEVVTLIQGELISLKWSKTYQALKCELGEEASGMELDSHAVRNLVVVHNSLGEIQEAIKKIG